MFLQQLAELHDRGSSGIGALKVSRANWRIGGDLLKRFLHGRIAHRKPVLQQVNAQHSLQRVWSTSATGLWVMRFDKGDQALSGYDLLRLGQKALTTGLFAFAGIFEIGKAHLAHGYDYRSWLGGWLFQHKLGGAFRLDRCSLSPARRRWAKCHTMCITICIFKAD